MAELLIDFAALAAAYLIGRRRGSRSARGEWYLMGYRTAWGRLNRMWIERDRDSRYGSLPLAMPTRETRLREGGLL